MKIKILFVAYWLACAAMATFAVANQWEGSIGTHGADPVVIALTPMLFGAIPAFFFIALFKVFRVIKKVNAPSWGNLLFWIVSLGLAIHAYGCLESGITSYGDSVYFYNYPHSGEGIAIAGLWVIVCACWIGFNKFCSK